MKTLYITLLLLPFLFAAYSGFAEITLQDHIGRTITLNKPARRIVALAPHIVENLYSAGAGEYIVGAVDYSDFPVEANKIPRVGSYTAYSLEAILAHKPDLVVVWRSGRGGKVMEKLISLGLNVYASNPLKLEDVARSISDYGKLAKTEPIANKNAQAFTEKLKYLQKRYSSQPTVNTFYQVWNDPLQTLNGKNIISDVLELCGGHNIFADAIPIAPKVSIESVIALNPSAIIASGMGRERPEWLDEWKKWRQITAVKQGNLFFVPPSIIQRHTTRILLGAEKICKHLATAR